MDTGLPHPHPDDCLGSLHPKAVEGFHLFNSGQYWQAHEALEAAWRDEKGEIRHLYRGILQVGVAYLHITHHNYAGAIKLYHRSQRWLAPFPAVCRGVEVARLRQDFEQVIQAVRFLGPHRLDEFDRVLLKPVVWGVPSPDRGQK